MSCYKSLFMFLSFALGLSTHAVYNYYFTKKKKQEIHEVIMFSYGLQQIAKSKYSRCMITESMARLLYYLNKPKYNLDVCMYVLTNMDLTNVLLKLHGRGVKIRIIVDADMAFSAGSGIKRLIKQRIPVRWMKSTSFMHHKFCVVDKLCTDSGVTPFLMSGSLNFTNQGLNGNYENYLVTSQKQLVDKYQEEFERLWVLFKPIVD